MNKLHVFISWAGARAEAIGKGFRDFLPDVINAVEPFMSGSDIDKGRRWGNVLVSGLKDSSCAIVCLTPESVSSIWVAFETGAVSRAAGGPDDAKSRIWTYLDGLDTRDLQLLPFAEYQATVATEQDTYKLIRSINQLSPDVISEDALKRRFEGVFWPQFSRVIDAARNIDSATGAPGVVSEPDLTAEILRTVRSIQQELNRSRNDLLPLQADAAFFESRASILRELEKRGVVDPGIDRDLRGRWLFRQRGRETGFAPGVIERGIAAGTLDAARIADMVARDLVDSDSPPSGAGPKVPSPD